MKFWWICNLWCEGLIFVLFIIFFKNSASIGLIDLQESIRYTVWVELERIENYLHQLYFNLNLKVSGSGTIFQHTGWILKVSGSGTIFQQKGWIELKPKWILSEETWKNANRASFSLKALRNVIGIHFFHKFVIVDIKG